MAMRFISIMMKMTVITIVILVVIIVLLHSVIWVPQALPASVMLPVTLMTRFVAEIQTPQTFSSSQVHTCPLPTYLLRKTYVLFITKVRTAFPIFLLLLLLSHIVYFSCSYLIFNRL